MVDRVVAAGVDDIACLVDFGVPNDRIPPVIPLIGALVGNRRTDREVIESEH
jgi:hypothetical protein